MNILITSVGRRTKLVEYFKREFNKVIVTDMSEYAPALYKADKYYILPSINDKNYLERVKIICKENKIDGILSLIDPELELLSKNKKEFEQIGVTVVGSSYDVSKLCFDKWEMYKFLKQNNFLTAKTFNNLIDFKQEYLEKKIEFPVILKPRTGSASIGIKKIEGMLELEYWWNQKKEDYIIQEFLFGEEIGCDVYTDLISKKIISIFTKKKINMRAGETDKAFSFKNLKLFKLLEEFVVKLESIGPIDIDVFKVGEKYYISEVNPRFGGGYLAAHECGINFPKMIKSNLNGLINQEMIGQYEEHKVILKCDDVVKIEMLEEENV